MSDTASGPFGVPRPLGVGPFVDTDAEFSVSDSLTIVVRVDAGERRVPDPQTDRERFQEEARRMEVLGGDVIREVTGTDRFGVEPIPADTWAFRLSIDALPLDTDDVPRLADGLADVVRERGYTVEQTGVTIG